MATPSTALRVQTKAAGIDTLVLTHVAQAQPTCTADQVVIEVRAAAINPSDVKATLGIMPHAVFPRTPGRDFAGVVVAGAAEHLGKEVWGSGGDVGITRDGSHARYLVLPANAVQLRPQAISMDEAGAVGVPFVTACEGFRRAGGVQRGQTVVVFGANGKVGQAAVQIAARAGAKVIAVQRQDSLQGHSCAPVDVINAQRTEPASRILELTNGRGAGIVFNTVDSIYFEAAHAVMAKGAAQIFIIATKGKTVAFDVFKFYRGVHTFVGLDTLALDCVYSSQLLGELRAGFEDGSLKPYPVRAADTFSLADALGAYKKVLAGASDRVVLHP